MKQVLINARKLLETTWVGRCPDFDNINEHCMVTAITNCCPKEENKFKVIAPFCDFLGVPSLTKFNDERTKEEVLKAFDDFIEVQEK